MGRLEREVETIKGAYPAGTRLTLVRMAEDPHPLPPGSHGTVAEVDDIGNIWVDWDCGCRRALVFRADNFRKLEEGTK